MRTLITLLCALIAAPALAQDDVPFESRFADLVIYNARIWTGDPAMPEADAVAVSGDRIVEVFDKPARFQTRVDGATTLINARGARVIPGLIDAHVHLAGAARDAAALDLRPATSKADLLNRLRRHAQGQPEGAWILGARWTSDSWPDPTPPTAAEIDAAVGGRPAALERMDGHQLLASTRALELADIAADTPDPPGGQIGRTPEGRLTGALYEEAMALVESLVPPLEDDRFRELLTKVAQHAAESGVTRVGSIDSLAVIRDHLVPLAERGDLPIRVASTVSESTNDLAEWRDALEWAAASPAPAPGLTVVGFKGYVDGTLGSRTAWMHDAFHDNPPSKGPDNAGFPLAMAEDGRLRQLVETGAAMGLQPIVHAIGDRANHVALNWFADLPEETRRRVRPAVEHAQHLAPEDLPRFAELGVIASLQPLHKADDGRYAESRLGPERLDTSYAFRDLLDSGAVVAFGSDWPVVSVNPFLGIWAAVAARTTEGRPFVPEQSITVEEALEAYTTGAATKLFAEDRAGVIRFGMQADLVMLDRDLLTIPIEEIKGVKPVVTIVGGDIIYDAR